MRAYINVWDKTYPVGVISWFNDGKISSVAFIEENGVAITIFHSDDISTEKEMVLIDGVYHADLNKRITWEEL
ncbi:hypothetical protein ACW0TQ_07975 [Oceanobacillus sp. M60]|uniref:Uncharacterized protein n=1 Tax=Oceanobacillus aidingensis TaxID=645964 RepID=A0ABV9JVA3_9BACI|nr:hypothetical protein [Oceanobacillus oncorhynchi]